MKKEIIFVLCVLFALTINSYAIKLKQALEANDKADAQNATIATEIDKICMAMNPANLLKCSWIGEDGKIGEDSNPKCVIEDNNGILTFGVLLEVDTEKYMEQVYLPLKKILDAHAKIFDEGEIVPNEHEYSQCLADDPLCLKVVNLAYNEQLNDKSKCVYSYKNKKVMNIKSKFFQDSNGFFMLSKIENGIIKYTAYDTSKDPKFTKMVGECLEKYIRNFGEAKMKIKAVDKDNNLLGTVQEVKINSFMKRDNKGDMRYFLKAVYLYSNCVPVFVHGLFRMDACKFFDFSNVYSEYIDDIFTQKMLLSGELHVPKDDLEAVTNIIFEFEP